MIREYTMEKEFQTNDLYSIKKGIDTLLSQPNEKSVIERLLANGIAGIGFWATAPVPVTVANIIAGLVFGTFSEAGGLTRNYMEQGRNQIANIVADLFANKYTAVKLRMAVLDTGDGVTMIEAAMVIGYYKNGKWILMSL